MALWREEDYSVFGVRKMQVVLNREEENSSIGHATRCTVARLMAGEGLQGQHARDDPPLTGESHD